MKCPYNIAKKISNWPLSKISILKFNCTFLNPVKALEWVGDPRSGTGYHRWFGRANNWDPWTTKWWFGRTDYKLDHYQQNKGDPGSMSGWGMYDKPSEQPYVKIPRQMLTLGFPDKGPVPYWKDLELDILYPDAVNPNKYPLGLAAGSPDRPDPDIDTLVGKKADKTKSEFKNHGITRTPRERDV